MGLARRRALFVIDAKGRIAYAHVHRLGLTYEKVDHIAAILQSLATAATQAYPDEPATAAQTDAIDTPPKSRNRD
jgi:alkyl hydroperoxide reductase subunit AhpC